MILEIRQLLNLVAKAIVRRSSLNNVAILITQVNKETKNRYGAIVSFRKRYTRRGAREQDSS